MTGILTVRTWQTIPTRKLSLGLTFSPSFEKVKAIFNLVCSTIALSTNTLAVYQLQVSMSSCLLCIESLLSVSQQQANYWRKEKQFPSLLFHYSSWATHIFSYTNCIWLGVTTDFLMLPWFYMVCWNLGSLYCTAILHPYELLLLTMIMTICSGVSEWIEFYSSCVL